MKYVLIVAIIILVVRVDYWLNLLGKAQDSLTSEIAEVETDGSSSNREVVGINQDPSLKQNSRTTFFSLLEDFRTSPSSEQREKAIAILKANPKMFGPLLDQELEAAIFGLRDLLNNNDPQVVLFIYDLQSILQGEHLLMLKRFLALWMEINMEHFIAAYSKSKDPNCMIASLFGDNIPEEEKIKEYYEREDSLKAILAKEKIEPAEKLLATNCLLVLGLAIQKIVATFPPPEPASDFSNDQSGASAEDPPAGVSP